MNKSIFQRKGLRLYFRFGTLIPNMTSVATSHSLKSRTRPQSGDFFISQAAALTLAGGTRFNGAVPEGQADSLTGEVVFTTGMTGYVNTLTDPSYSGQIIVFTYPLIGNYGVPGPSGWESTKIHARGVVVSELAGFWSHAGHPKGLGKWLAEQHVPIITGVDTRALTKYLRTRGTTAGIISTSAANLPAGTTVAIPKVSCTTPELINAGHRKTIVLVDCGLKQNIIRSLVKQGVTIKRVPYDYDYTNEPYDGLLVSNGPGDPTDYPETIAVLRRALAAPQPKPVFGICLGTQLLGLAAGARTYKLLFGHRGHNQPAATPDGRAFITSQNHGYAIDEKSLPTGWHVTFRNLNDNSIEGIAHDSLPFSAVQFHPEATPGPTDTAWLFNDFAKAL
ncbi:MAG TPA: glutamine-hydrolyzing carbamoyl-phosphate synthase small subunit [Candidatus Saccharimonadia bacterium]|jgi:carbamoyl-phosphate synthase small subunit|nr:glutamine-hydrolyzing carbamoyl-phosphate synthase small subunit [Candidatus Saccharimonadia bacterium]